MLGRQNARSSAHALIRGTWPASLDLIQRNTGPSAQAKSSIDAGSPCRTPFSTENSIPVAPG
eukprot:754266-Pyramimonas_sp.AAC.1